MTSQINPLNIDGNYPVPGVPNNTQGMRDNFTNTKTNFQFARDEITQLQNSAVLKAAIPGTVLDNNMNDGVIRAAKLQDTSFAYVAVTQTVGSIELDYSVGAFQQINLTGSISIGFVNWPPAGSAGVLRVGFRVNDVLQTVTLPASVSQGLFGLEGVSPGTPGVSNTITFGRVGNFAFEFVSIDGGTTVWIFDDSRPNDRFFSNVRIDDATESTSPSTGALTVTGGVGIGGNLYVGGEIVGNIVVAGVNVVGNVQAGNLLANAAVLATGNVTGGNLRTTGSVSATGNVIGGNILGGNLSLSGNVINSLSVTGNVISGNISTPGLISVAGNVTGANLRTTGLASASGNVIGGNITTVGQVTATGNVTGGNIITAGTVRSSGSTSGVGYATGAGGTVTQLTSKSTGVTLNNITGQITTHNATLNGDTSVTFELTNSAVANTDVMVINHVSGGTIGKYTFNAACNTGAANVTIHNVTSGGGSAEGAALVLRYVVIKGALS
jgi:hypothetical protein